MTASRIVLVGGGEHARVVAEAARSAGAVLAGFVDPLPCADTAALLGIARLGDDDALASQSRVVGLLGVGAVGVTNLRRRVVERVGARLERWVSVVHASAWVSPTALIGEGAVVMAGAVVNAHATIGRHCVVNTGAIVEHDVVLGDFAQLAPGVTVGGGTRIGSDAFVGLGAALRDHIEIGDRAFVPMGAVITSSLPPDADGAPAIRRAR